MEANGPNAPKTFDQLMLPHMDAAYNLARWLLRDSHDAEDALQDACLRAYRSADNFRGGDGRPWFLTIVRNVCYSKIRERRRDPASEAFHDDAHGSKFDPAELNAIAWRETKGQILQKALEQIPDEYREVIVLHEIEGLAYKEIAAVAGIPMGTVMSRLARARRRLQAELLKLSEPKGDDGM